MCNLLPAKGMTEPELTAAIDHACDSLNRAVRGSPR
jgi:hypothetical protein